MKEGAIAKKDEERIFIQQFKKNFGRMVSKRGGGVNRRSHDFTQEAEQNSEPYDDQVGGKLNLGNRDTENETLEELKGRMTRLEQMF